MVPLRHNVIPAKTLVLVSLMVASAQAMLTTGCGSDGSAPPREIDTVVSIGALGISEELAFEIPADTRSVSVVIEGDDTELYALAAFEIGQAELVGIPLDASPAAAMREHYEIEQVGQMPGGLFQSIRLGTYTHLYPYAPGQQAVAGPARLRVASTQTSGEVRVRVLLPADDGSNTLHLNFISVSESGPLPDMPAFAERVSEILGSGGVVVTVDQTLHAAGTGLATITDFSEPQEAPGSMSAALAGVGATLTDNGALNVFFVDSLPFGVGGLSLGTPGPPYSDSYYFGVLVRLGADDEVLARVTAHEVAHFVALHHVENRGVSGDRYPDPLDDTSTSMPNLMESGSTLTPGQAFALSRSPLLRLD